MEENKEQSIRYNDNKTQWSLVDYEALEPLAKVLEFGAEKYARDNWKIGMPVTSVCDSMLRHIYAFMSGEDNDPESGISHIGHIMCNAMFVSNYMKHRQAFDDRNKK